MQIRYIFPQHQRSAVQCRWVFKLQDSSHPFLNLPCVLFCGLVKLCKGTDEFHIAKYIYIWYDIRDLCLRLMLHSLFEPWLSPHVFAGGGSHRDWSETTDTGYVSLLQQAQEQILLPLGSWHYLKEKNKSPPYNQPGLPFQFQNDQ